MVAVLQENQSVKIIYGEPGVGEYRQMAEILIQAIPNDRKSMWAGKVMAYLANEALRAASHNQLPARVPT